MLQLHKTEDGKQFFTRTTGNNNEVLHHSEPVKRRAFALKNFAATAEQYSTKWDGVYTDYTGKKPVSKTDQKYKDAYIASIQINAQPKF